MSHTKFSFALVLAIDEMTDELAEALYEAGCDDGTIAGSGGVERIYFDRVAPSLGQAIAGAIRNVEAAGCKVERLELSADQIPQLEGCEHAA